MTVSCIALGNSTCHCKSLMEQDLSDIGWIRFPPNNWKRYTNTCCVHSWFINCLNYLIWNNDLEVTSLRGQRRPGNTSDLMLVTGDLFHVNECMATQVLEGNYHKGTQFLPRSLHKQREWHLTKFSVKYQVWGALCIVHWLTNVIYHL